MTACRLVRLFLAGIFVTSSAITLRAQLYVANSPEGAISEYDATTGALIKDSLVTGLGHVRAVAYDDGALYVINARRRVVAKYDAKTGVEINTQLVTGLDIPSALAVSGHDLYVASFDGVSSEIIGKYDAITGAVVYFKLIPKLNFTTALAVHDHQLFVARSFSPNGGGLVIMDKYDAITGALLKEAFIPEMADPGVIAQSGNDIWVSHAVGVITKHDCETGANSFGMRLPLVSGLNQTCGIAVSGDNLFVASRTTKMIGKYNASTGAVLNAAFVTGLDPGGLPLLAAVPSQADDSGDSWALFFDKRHLIRLLAPVPQWVINTVCLVILLGIVVLIISPFAWAGTRFTSRRKEIFPQGMQRMTILSVAGGPAPAAGCAIVSDSVELQLAGLLVGDIIVALDGYQVETPEQYAYIDSLANNANMRLIVWRVNHYLEVARWVPDRKLDSRFEAYSAPAA